MGKGIFAVGLIGGLIVCFIVAFLLGGFLSASNVPLIDQTDVDEAYVSGLSVGDVQGYARGLGEGNSSGYVSGYDVGFGAGVASVPRVTPQPVPPDRYDDGYSAGVSAGETQGYGEGFAVGNSSGYSTGYSVGVVDGAGSGFNIRDPSFAEMEAFLLADKTDENVYDLLSYNCLNYCADVIDNAYSQGLRVGFVYVEFADGAHALVCFDTVDNGLVFVEPQSDSIVSLTVGGDYEFVESPNTVVAFTVIW